MAKAPTPTSLGAIEADWQAEDDMRTLLRAAEIKKDAKRLAAAKKKAKEQYAKMEAAGLCGDKRN